MQTDDTLLVHKVHVPSDKSNKSLYRRDHMCVYHLPSSTVMLTVFSVCPNSRWSARSGLVMVRSWSWSCCSAPDVLLFRLWLRWVLWAAWSCWRLCVGRSLPGHLHCPPGSVDSFSFSFQWVLMSHQNERRGCYPAKEVMFWPVFVCFF